MRQNTQPELPKQPSSRRFANDRPQFSESMLSVDNERGPRRGEMVRVGTVSAGLRSFGRIAFQNQGPARRADFIDPFVLPADVASILSDKNVFGGCPG